MPNMASQTPKRNERTESKKIKSMNNLQPLLPKGNKWLKDRHGNIGDDESFLEAYARKPAEKKTYGYHESEKICGNVSARADKKAGIPTKKRPLTLNKSSSKMPNKSARAFSKKKNDHLVPKAGARKISKKEEPSRDYIKERAAQLRREYMNNEF